MTMSPTDELVRTVLAKLDADKSMIPLTLNVLSNGAAEVSWIRNYPPPTDDEAAAGLGGGPSDERRVTAATITDALMAVLTYEEEADVRDRQFVEAANTLAAKNRITAGRPRVNPH